jgi:hypothetical protein
MKIFSTVDLLARRLRRRPSLSRSSSRRLKAAAKTLGSKEPGLARADFLVELRGFEPMAIAGAVSSELFLF